MKTCVLRTEERGAGCVDDSAQTTEEVEEAIKKGLPVEQPVSIAVALCGLEMLKYLT